MLLNFLWFGLILLSVLADLCSGQPFSSSQAALAGAAAGIELTLSLAGPICLWSALARAMEQTGLTVRLCRALRPGLRRLFPACAADEEGFSSLCGNLAANLLGLGNAATPLGVRAAQRMQALSGAAHASDEMCLLVVMNTASLAAHPGRRSPPCAQGSARRTRSISSRRCGWRRPAPSRQGSWRHGG